ncbi:hypothetical protein [Pseudonocardia dioxanivorans]|uniref:hypothetical protein n=1 Tax=Pseudonocardia dioxanivorans TaxID=240495 RepID=UPI001F3ABAA5|nr:hypothetical protein [Pseudonocardia dioxanivorans]
MQTARRRDWQNLVVLLSLILGVVAMHSTVASHDDAGSLQNVAMHTAVAIPPTAVHGGSVTAAAEATIASATASPDPAAAFSSGPRAAAAEVVVASAMSGMDDGALTGPAEPAGGHSALHDLLHLCLAVLTALLALAVAALLAFVLGRTAQPGTITRGGRPVVGPRAPPPTSVRLAQLCVLRN